VAVFEIELGTGRVELRLTDGERLPFQPGELDGGCCISVLEHVPRPATVVEELARVIERVGPSSSRSTRAGA